MQKIIIALLFTYSLFGCSQPATVVKESTPIEASNIKGITGLPPIYESFEDLAPIFNQSSDSIYVINFWATWCAPCVKELPYFEALNEKYAPQKVKVILVSLDFKNQLETKLKPFLEKNQLNSDLLILTDPDANSWVDKVDPTWSGAIPATVVYKQNKKEFFEKSFENLEELEAIIKPFL